MHPKVSLLKTPPPAEMAAELLQSGSRMILDHYSATQGQRMLQLLETHPLQLLEEMWRALRQFNLTQLDLAKAAKVSDPAEMRMEAYQSLYPATENQPDDALTLSGRQKIDDWLESLAPEPSR